MKQFNILVVDDDYSVTTSIALLLKQQGMRPFKASSHDEALAILRSEIIHCVIQDMNFSRSTSGLEGLALLKAIKQQNAEVPVILLTAWGSIELAVEGMKHGAADFMSKPWDNEHLVRTLETTLSLCKEQQRDELQRQELDELYDFSGIIGCHPSLTKVLQTIGRVANTDASVLILGESGTGKELIADAVHNNSARRAKEMVKVNLGGISSSLFESEMFGHVRGAFTDARSDREGRFALANESTIFLDEIGDLDKSSQVKLLRILQDQSFQPVGSSKTLRANVRVVSATNCDLNEMVAAGTFREDLLFRLNLITVHLPPLRERKSDIPLLVEHHLNRVSQLYGLEPLSIEASAMQWLQQQPWPGNIRELTQTIERAILMSNKTHLGLADFQVPVPSESTSDTEALPEVGSMTLSEMEQAMIKQALEAYDGNISRVADALGVSRSALYRRLEKYEING
ncbi:sigma-54 dependent transcriptional regulator [Pleionea sp. CnH1-48]|uniref:sigma-54-dependent transcriptional regulator n=1 Tax=Pleionea sp. CnH1-48 TaxID=2954494 RepID=UPI0020978B6B|nr:sigma-54 dependent transcriptional regulator [Pleionea sp. CnH1-48]MCO7226035.1 sigma-54 dependent transcriptional regulator [Pleionea sp. CnH1-48]